MKGSDVTLRFLGTGTSQGVPVVGCTCHVCVSNDPRDSRLRSSVIISDGRSNLLIDTGPDLRQQLLSNDITYIDAILYTHEHNDHVIGLDDIRPIYFQHPGNVPSYALKRVHSELRKRFHYMFADQIYPGVAQLETHDISMDQESFTIKGVEIVPLNVQHGKMSILGYRINQLAYITDASYISEATMRKLEGIDTLVINALRHESHHSHYNLKEAVAFIQATGAQKGYLTHISHHLGRHEEIDIQIPDHIHLAYDGLVIS